MTQAVAPFTRPLLVRFRHCDPAGIVFYPRYFEIINDLVETWFAEGLGISFHALQTERQMGIPTASVQCDFRAPSRWDDQLTQTLHVERLGGASVNLVISLTGPDHDVRLTARLTLVSVDITKMRATPLPDDLRLGMRNFLIPGSGPDPA